MNSFTPQLPPASTQERRRSYPTWWHALLVALVALIGIASLGIGSPVANAQASALSRAVVVNGSASAQDFGDTFAKVQTVGIGTGFRAVTVQLR